MQTTKKISLWFIGAAFAVVLFHTPSNAASSATVTVQVSISGSKSIAIAVNVSTYSFGALGINTSSVAAPITVTNDSVAFQESYALQGANAVSTGGGTSWTLTSSTGALDAYALQVQFSSATPANVDSAWGNPATNLTTGVQNCTSGSTFGNGTVGESCFQVFPISGYNTRNMFLRMHTPVQVSDNTQRQTSVVLTIQ